MTTDTSVVSALTPPAAAETPPATPDPWVDFVVPRHKPAESKELSLTVADDRDGRLSPAAARWVQERCTALWAASPTPAPFTVKLRIQHNVNDGTVSLLPSIEDRREALRVRSHRGATLAVRFYVIKLIRAGLVHKGRTYRLRPDGDRLVVVGVKAPV